MIGFGEENQSFWVYYLYNIQTERKYLTKKLVDKWFNCHARMFAIGYIFR
jgi:hypothetical protein